VDVVNSGKEPPVGCDRLIRYIIPYRATKLVENARPTSVLSRHIRIGYFWIHDLLTKNIIKILYCPTEKLIADIMTKPLPGSLFKTMRDRLMGAVPCPMTEA
jgi:hypothetical protein